MKRILTAIIIMSATMPCIMAQKSVSSGISRKSATADTRRTTARGGVNTAAGSATEVKTTDPAWMNVVYRSLDLNDPVNAVLYYPEEAADGQDNLFRLMLRLIAGNNIAAYEYLDGRENFSETNRLNVKDMLDRFQIMHTDAKGSTERRPLYEIADVDMPSTEILSYFIIESNEFDRRDSRMRRRIEAICPVLHRTEEFGHEAVRYPMFWVRYDDLKPHLALTSVFLSDENHVASSTLEDYFNLNLYNGEIFKTRNLRNKSMSQLYPDPDDLKHARDSIDKRIDAFADALWVPDPEEIARREEMKAASDTTASAKADTPKSRRVAASRGTSKKADKTVKKESRSRRSTPAATRSVRNRRK